MFNRYGVAAQGTTTIPEAMINGVPTHFLRWIQDMNTLDAKRADGALITWPEIDSILYIMYTFKLAEKVVRRNAARASARAASYGGGGGGGNGDGGSRSGGRGGGSGGSGGVRFVNALDDSLGSSRIADPLTWPPDHIACRNKRCVKCFKPMLHNAAFCFNPTTCGKAGGYSMFPDSWVCDGELCSANINRGGLLVCNVWGCGRDHTLTNPPILITEAMKNRYFTMVHDEHKKRVKLSLRVGGGMGGNSLPGAPWPLKAAVHQVHQVGAPAPGSTQTPAATMAIITSGGKRNPSDGGVMEREEYAPTADWVRGDGPGVATWLSARSSATPWRRTGRAVATPGDGAPVGNAATTKGGGAPVGSAATTKGGGAPVGSAATTKGGGAPVGSAATT
jgi:hypothetical protein